MYERPRLVLNRAGYGRVGVPQAVDGDACHQVQVAATVLVANTAAMPADQDYGLPVVGA
jgi:hypothetical protein